MKNKVAIVGATGNVGRKILELLLLRSKINPQLLRLYASSRSKGKKLNINAFEFPIEDAEKADFQDCFLALFSTDSSISKNLVPKALQAGAFVIDSSSAHRLNTQVPLVVAPVNGHLILKESKLYSTPNCLASPISIVLKPLHEKFAAGRVIASTYQSTSGAGKDAMDELYQNTAAHLKGEKAPSKCFARQIAFNVIPQVDKILEDGFTAEEHKIIQEVNKIVSSEIKVLATSVRVPVGIGHCISLAIEFNHPCPLEEVRDTLTASPGVIFSKDHYTTPLEAEGKDEVFVGRLRKDPTVPHGISLWLASDNLRRGAALDAVEIAEKLLIFCTPN